MAGKHYMATTEVEKMNLSRGTPITIVCEDRAVKEDDVGRLNKDEQRGYYG